MYNYIQKQLDIEEFSQELNEIVNNVHTIELAKIREKLIEPSSLPSFVLADIRITK